jgi:hypothetical protein
VGHENLRSGMGLRQATPHPGVLFTSSRHARYQRHVSVHLAGSSDIYNIILNRVVSYISVLDHQQGQRMS